MTMTSGFFDSVDHDRQYTAEQFGQILDYLINDGVYWKYPESGVTYTEDGKPANLIPPFQVSFTLDRDSYYNPDGAAIIIGPGRAWFDHTWTLVTTPEIVALPLHDDGEGARWDAVVLTMNKTAPVRRNYFRVIQGVPGADPGENAGITDIIEQCFSQGSSKLLGSYMHNDEVHDVPIAFVRRPLGRVATDAVQSRDIVSCVGQNLCPYVVGTVSYEPDGTEKGTDLFSTQVLFEKWNKQWAEFLASTQEEANEWHALYGDSTTGWTEEWDRFLDGRAADFMRFIKMLDRIWHVWYQGSVNWVYEYLRRLEGYEEDFFEKWSCLIHDAEDILQNGLGKYSEQIESLLAKYDELDDLVEQRIEELSDQLDRTLEDRLDGFDERTEQLVQDKLESMRQELVLQIVENMKTDVFNEMTNQVQQLVDNSVNNYMKNDLDDLQRQLDAAIKKAWDEFSARLDVIAQDFGDAFNQFLNQTVDIINEALESNESVKEQITTVVTTEVEKQLTGYLEEHANEIFEKIRDEFAKDVEGYVSELVTQQMGDMQSRIEQLEQTVAALQIRLDNDYLERG